MTSSEIVARLGVISDELTGMDAEAMDEATEARFTELTTESDSLAAELDKAEARMEARGRVAAAAARVAPVSGDGARSVQVAVKSDPYDLSTLRFDESASSLRGRAETAIEQTIGDVDDSHRDAAIKALRGVNDPTGVLARRILATGSPAYRSATMKVIGGQDMLLDTDERQALSRAQSLTGNAGGFAIPFTLDPTIIMTNAGAANPFRQVSRIEQIVTDSWNGVSSTGVSGGYAAEASEVGDDSATLVQPTVDVERWDAFVPFSFEVGQDWANLEADVRMMVAEKRDEFDTIAFTTGSGTNQPTGIITALDGTASEIAPTVVETFSAADVYKLIESLPPRYRRTAAQAAFMGDLGTFNAIRQFDANGGSALWETIGGGLPSELVGYGVAENSAMASSTAIDAAATADNLILAVGDWRNYLIVDRVGVNFELVPHLFATANNRPSGQRGFLAWGRTGAGCLNINAFRLLNVATTA
jgi:HK97 family phage major capsid protein